MGAAVRYARGRRGSVTFAVVDERGALHGHRVDRGVPAASVFKAMLMAAYLSRRSVRSRPLRRGDRALLAPMIRWSDNATATRIRNLLGARAIYALARRAGMRRFRLRVPWGQSRVTAAEQARFFHRYERHIPKRHREYARRLLSTVVPAQRWGLPAVRPQGWALFFKGGWGSGTGRVTHQAAWLERGGRRVAIAIFTERSPSFRYGQVTVREVARRLLRGLR